MNPLEIVMMGRISAPAVPPLTNLLEWWKLNTGLTQSGGVASAWAGQISGTSLAQANSNKQPAVQGDGSLLFDGGVDFLKAVITLAQPLTIYAKAKQLVWLGNRTFWDGATTDVLEVYQSGVSPNLNMFAGTVLAGNGNLPVNTYGVICAVYNGASSLLQIDATTPLTGNAGANGTTGFTIASQGGGGQSLNCQFKEVLIYSAAHDATQRAAVRAYLATVP